MNNILTYGWIMCFLVAYLIQTILPFTLPSTVQSTVSGDNTVNTGKIDVFLLVIAWVLSIAGFFMFIIWLTKFKDVKVLQTMWIVSLVTFVISIGTLIFMAGNTSIELLLIPSNLLGYSFTIFIGTLITFFIRNK